MWMVLDAYNGVSAGGATPSSGAWARRARRSGRRACTRTWAVENGQDFRPGQEGRTLPGMGGVGTFGGSEDHTAIMAAPLAA